MEKTELTRPELSEEHIREFIEMLDMCIEDLPMFLADYGNKKLDDLEKFLELGFEKRASTKSYDEGYEDGKADEQESWLELSAYEVEDNLPHQAAVLVLHYLARAKEIGLDEAYQEAEANYLTTMPIVGNK